MPVIGEPQALQIAEIDGEMVMYVVNSVPPVLYRFTGGTLQAQMDSVRLLANRMSNGVDAVRDAVDVIFDDADNADVFARLFQASKGMAYLDDVVVPFGADVSFLVEQTMIDAGAVLLALV